MKITRRLLITSGALALALAGTGTGIALSGTAPSYPHPWCAATLHSMYGTGTGPLQDYLSALQDEESQGAPTGQLLADETTLLTDMTIASSASIYSYQADLAATITQMHVVSADAAAINRACGKPANWNLAKLAVPASN